MSIAKPTLSNPWCSGTPANMTTPGSVNDTGIPSAATSIPRRWFNWVLNKVDTSVRYLMAYGIPWWDAAETNYDLGSLVRYSPAPGIGLVYECILAPTGPDYSNYPGDGTHWQRWGWSLPELTTFVASQVSTVPPSSAHIVVTPSGVGADPIVPTNIAMLSVPAVSGGGPGFKSLTFKIADIETDNGTVTVVLSGAAAFSSFFNVNATGADDWNTATVPTARQTGANTFVIKYDHAFVGGAVPSLFVTVTGF